MDALKNVEAVEVDSVEAERIDRVAKKKEKTGKNKAKEIIALGGLFLLSLVLPVFGLCYWLGVRTEKAKRAKSALIGAVVSGLLCVTVSVFIIALNIAIGAALVVFFSPLLLLWTVLMVCYNAAALMINIYLALVALLFFFMLPFAFIAALFGV